MLSSLTKTRPPLTKICEQPLNVSSRFFASTSTTRARPGFSENETSRWKRNNYSGSTPNLPSFATNEQSRPAFGLRPPGKQPWDESDPRFVNEDPKLELRFGEASKTRAMLKVEGKLQVPKGPPQLFPLTEHVPDEPQSPEARHRSFDPPPHQMRHYGLSSDILSMPGRREESSPQTPPTRPSISEHQTPPTFDGPSSSQDVRTIEPTQYLMIQDFKGLRSDLTPVLDLFTESQLHLVPVQVEGTKSRVDALMKFNTRRDTLDARRRLEEQMHTPTGNSCEVRMIDKSQFLSAVNSPEDQASMAGFATPPTASLASIRSENGNYPQSAPSQTLWLGNIPNELLLDKEEIIAKFNKYGKITDVRIPDKGTGLPRGYMYLEFLLQEDADKCFQELKKAPLFLFGRSVRVDYAPPQHGPKGPSIQRDADRRSPNTVLLYRVSDQLHTNSWALLEAVSHFGDIVDLRIIRSGSLVRLPPGSAFVDFLHVSDAEKMIEEVNAGKVHSLGPDIGADYGSKVTVKWDVVTNPPSDTLRAWGFPLRALSSETMLREAFGDNRKLIDIRIPKRRDGWPIGSVYLQFASVEAAKKTFDWMLSDPEDPITFFGREIRANFIESGDFRPRSRSGSNPSGDYYDTLMKGSRTTHERPSQQTQDHGWASRGTRATDTTNSLSESNTRDSH